MEYGETLTEKRAPSLFNHALRYGLYTSVVYILYQLLMYVIGMSTNTALGYLSYLILIGGIVLATKSYRDKVNGGYISYGNAFLIGLYVSIVVGIIMSIFSYLYLNYIAPDAMQEITRAAEEKMYDQGLSDEQVEAALAMQQKMMTPVFMMIMGLLGYLIGGAIISLITAAFLKKENRNFDAEFTNVE